MSEPVPLIFEWDGEVMRPLRPRIADREYVVGEQYRLGVIEERSQNSHSHYFAALHESWLNLPDNLAERFPTADHLRKYCLIKSGYADERSIVCASAAEAQRVASFIKPMDGYALVTVSGPCVRVFTAKSQSYRAMGKEDFGKSKTAVLDIVSDMIGVTPNALSANAVRRLMREEAG